MNSMVIGVPREVKVREYRVALIPGQVRLLVDAGHTVLVGTGAGQGSGITDDQFMRAGARLVDSPRDLYSQADMICKVKEPVPEEWPLLREEQVLFAFLHLAAAPELSRALRERRVDAVGFETVQLDDGTLPILMPMSEVAGKMSVQAGSYYLRKDNGGKGVLLGGVPGVRHGRVTIIGGGVVGFNAAKVALGCGAEVSILDVSLPRLSYLDDIFQGKATTLMSNPSTIEESVRASDLLIGAVLRTGARAQVLVPKDLVSRMEQGSVIVDVSVDQGGCVETIRPTTHDDPVFESFGVIHYGVTNMPGAVPQTSTYALANAAFPYAMRIAQSGLEGAVEEDRGLARGVNVRRGKIVHAAVSEALGLSPA